MAISDHSLNFNASGVREFQAVGQFIRVRSSSSPVYISVDGSGEFLREQGEQINIGRSTARVRVRSLVAQDVVLISSSESQDDNRTAVNLSVAATVESGNDNQHLAKVSIAAGGSAKIADSNANRKFLRVSLLSSAVGHVLLGKSGVSAVAGGTLEEGMVDYVETTGEMWAFNPQAVPVDVFVMEINKF